MNDVLENKLKRVILDIKVLHILMARPYYEDELLQEVKNDSRIFASLKEGMFYARLCGLHDQEYIFCQSEFNKSKSRLLKMYSITETGKIQLNKCKKMWEFVTEEMSVILDREA